ncbi:alpha/beta fold hydrolase [Thermoproteota archaeon]
MFRGHGKSSRTPPYRYFDHINDTIGFLENNVILESVLFGSSMGGMISLMVAAKRPDLVKAVVFEDSSVTIERIRGVMVNYHSYWAGWRKLAEFKGSFEELVQLVADMPVNVPGQGKRKYGEGMDTIYLLNKANYLRYLDSRVFEDWVKGGSDRDAFERVTMGYDEKLLGEIKFPVLLTQGNPRKGGIFNDDAVEFSVSNIQKTYHVYIDEYDHNLGLYDWNTDKLLQSVNVFLETLR